MHRGGDQAVAVAGRFRRSAAVAVLGKLAFVDDVEPGRALLRYRVGDEGAQLCLVIGRIRIKRHKVGRLPTRVVSFVGAASHDRALRSRSFAFGPSNCAVQDQRAHSGGYRSSEVRHPAIRRERRIIGPEQFLQQRLA
jgi:hypothetical protein